MSLRIVSTNVEFSSAEADEKVETLDQKAENHCGACGAGPSEKGSFIGGAITVSLSHRHSLGGEAVNIAQIRDGSYRGMEEYVGPIRDSLCRFGVAQ